MNEPGFSKACISDTEVTPKVGEIRWTSPSPQLNSQSLESLFQEPGPGVEPIHLTNHRDWSQPSEVSSQDRAVLMVFAVFYAAAVSCQLLVI